MYHILVVGGGYLGSRIASYFRSQNQKVTVIKRTDSRIAYFESIGTQTIVSDLSIRETLPKIPKAHFVVICLAPESRTKQDYQKTYIHAVKNFLEAARKNSRPIFLTYLSSTGVYGPSIHGEVDEQTTPVPGTNCSRILLEVEDLVLNSGFSASVLRLSGLYGPQRNRVQAVLENKWPEAHPDRYLNMIYADDIPDLLPRFFKRAKPGAIYLASDDEPVLESTFYQWLCAKLGRPFPLEIFLRVNEQGKRYNNLRLKSLGIDLAHPTFREGYSKVLTSHSVT